MTRMYIYYQCTDPYPILEPDVGRVQKQALANIMHLSGAADILHCADAFMPHLGRKMSKARSPNSGMDW